MSLRRSQGFSYIEVIILVIVFGVGSAAGWWVWKNNKDNKPVAQQASSDSSPTPSATTDPQADWVKYTSATEGLSFLYPKEWTAQQDNGQLGGDRLLLTSPSGTAVRWDSYVSGIGGGCDASTEPHIFIDSVDPTAKVVALYLVSYAAQGNDPIWGLVDKVANAAPAVGDTGDCIFWDGFKSQDGQRDMWLHSNSAPKQQDVQTVKDILNSVYY